MISSLKPKVSKIQFELNNLVDSEPIDCDRIMVIFDEVLTTVRAVEKVCIRNKANPADLKKGVRTGYSWLKFLSEPDYFKMHIETLKTMRELIKERLKTRQKNIQIELSNIASLFKSKKVASNYLIQLNEGFIAANPEVIEAVVNRIFTGKTKQNRELIRRFEASDEYQNILIELDSIVSVETENHQGIFYDLEKIFVRINWDYFGGNLPRPHLCWSKKINRSSYGYYQRARDKVVINQVLDRSHVPIEALELVVYHELLHKYLGIKWVNGRAMVHTTEFRALERKYRQYNSAQNWLNSGKAFAF